MGEELELGQLYIKAGDGTYVPFEGIKPVDIWVGDEITQEVYDSLPQEGVIVFGTIRYRDYRRSAKKLRAQINGYYRRKRYAKRQKERARRRALKGAKYP